MKRPTEAQAARIDQAPTARLARSGRRPVSAVSTTANDLARTFRAWSPSSEPRRSIAANALTPLLDTLRADLRAANTIFDRIEEWRDWGLAMNSPDNGAVAAFEQAMDYLRDVRGLLGEAVELADAARETL